MTSARSAASTRTSRMSAPVTTFRFRLMRRSHGERRPSVSGETAPALPAMALSTAASVIPDPRVDEGVEEIHGQIDQDVRRRGHQNDALHDRIVAAHDGRDDQAAQAGDVEDDLGDDGAADQ